MDKELREEIRAKYPNVTFPTPVLEPLWYGRRPDTLVQNKYLIIDRDSGTQYAICSDDYGLLEHEEVVNIVEKATHSFPEYGKPSIEVKALKSGGRLIATIQFPEVQFEIAKNDFVNPQIEVFSSYDLGWKYGGRFGAFRKICSNGATVGVIFSKFAKRHLFSLDPSELTISIGTGMILFSDQVQLWTKWAEKNLIAAQYEQLWEALPFSAKERERIEALSEAATKKTLGEEKEKGREVTYWEAFSTVTQFVTHEIKSEMRRIEILPDVTRVFEKVWSN